MSVKFYPQRVAVDTGFIPTKQTVTIQMHLHRTQIFPFNFWQRTKVSSMCCQWVNLISTLLNLCPDNALMNWPNNECWFRIWNWPLIQQKIYTLRIIDKIDKISHELRLGFVPILLIIFFFFFFSCILFISFFIEVRSTWLFFFI